LERRIIQGRSIPKLLISWDMEIAIESILNLLSWLDCTLKVIKLYTSIWIYYISTRYGALLSNMKLLALDGR